MALAIIITVVIITFVSGVLNRGQWRAGGEFDFGSIAGKRIKRTPSPRPTAR